MRPAHAVAATLAVVAGLLGSANAAACVGPPGIVVDRSIGGIELHMTPDEVRAALGEPDAVLPSDLHFGWERWRYRDERLTVTIADGHEVWDVRTRSPRYRSDRGLRVGLRERAVRRRLPRARCARYGDPPEYRHRRVCTSGRPFDGPYTSVTLLRGVAREIRVAIGVAW